MKQEIVNINVSDIIPNRFQPRMRFDDNKLNELANSIRKYGIISPLILRKLDSKYEIIAGERRYKAALLIGLNTVPSVIMDLTDKESAEIALIENVQREDLNSIEEANSYNNLINNENSTKEQISQSISKNIATIETKLRLLNLSEKAKNALLNNLISEGHAKVLLRLNDLSRQDELLDRIMEERLNVKEASEQVRIINERGNNVFSNDTINLKDLDEPDISFEKNNINNALNQINFDEENKGDNYMNNDFNNNMNNGGLNSFSEPNKFFTSLEDQNVNLSAGDPQNMNGGDAFNIPAFNPNQFNSNDQNMPMNGGFNPVNNNQSFDGNPFGVPDNNGGQFMQSPNPFGEQQIPINNFQPDMNNQNFNSNQFMNNQQPMMNNDMPNNMFDQSMNSNPFDFNSNGQPFNQPVNNPEINPFAMNNEQDMNSNYGANFAPQMNQQNPAVDKIKALVDELKAGGFNIDLAESDLIDTFQLTINIRK